MGTLIGGHVGMDVTRTDGVIRKVAIHATGSTGNDVYQHNIAALHNEAEMLKIMSGSGYTPELIEVGPDWITQEDLGDQDKFSDDPEVFRQNCVRMLAAIRARGLRHGDLSGTNVLIFGSDVKAIDWQEGHRLADPAPQKSPYSDAYLIWRRVAGTYSKDKQLDTPRVARRMLSILGSLGAVTNLTLPLEGKTLLDIGCFQGDFTAAGAAEGMDAIGLDMGGFRSGEDSIANANALWGNLEFGRLRFRKGDVLDELHFNYDVVFLFSTWPYIVQQVGEVAAKNLITRILKQAGVLFFETQLAGDGPGPDFLPTDADVGQMLAACGASEVESLITIPVTSRPASRTVWRVSLT